jgi:hypothetical protein
MGTVEGSVLVVLRNNGIRYASEELKNSPPPPTTCGARSAALTPGERPLAMVCKEVLVLQAAQHRSCEHERTRRQSMSGFKAHDSCRSSWRVGNAGA